MILPSLFIPHGGGPCFFMKWIMGPPDTWDKMAAWLGQLGNSLDSKPRAIVVISGHWEEPHFTVTSSPHPPLIYDYSGFPPETYQLKYPAPGSPELAQRIVGLLADAGIPAHSDPERGFDHGVFIPFKVIYPQAEIPIVQLSLKSGFDPASHLNAGRALAPLLQEDVLVAGSGMSYHNMRGLMSGRNLPDSDQFDAWLSNVACDPDPDQRNEKLKQWQLAPAARSAHPREEHLMPLLVAAGAGAQAPGSKIFTDRVMGATVSAYRFG
jgi:aromatic ring-opening dioxygenase catalytic subunit (LigB family)